jgi:hypothetical protein
MTSSASGDALDVRPEGLGGGANHFLSGREVGPVAAENDLQRVGGRGIGERK